MHPILRRQLKQAGVTDQSSTDPSWQKFLEGLERAFAQADQDRYLIERSLALSSEEMQELHAQLATERDAVRAVVQSLAEGVCALDHRGELTLINPEAARLLAIDAETAHGRRLADLVDARDAHGRTLDEVIAADVPAEPEPRLLISAHPTAFITYSVRRLPGDQPGTLLTLRDISERKRYEAEREALNGRLVDLSRQAGMAEIASGVLHNVGNALNSVNVSVSIARDTLRKSRLAGLAKVADLLMSQGADLASFLCNDRGRELPAYLAALAAELGAEHARLQDEMDSLTTNIDHIRRIVDTQQQFARPADVVEQTTIAELLEASLRIGAVSYERHGINVALELEATGPIQIDRHQVIQILVNLLSNAKDALHTRPRGERRVVVRAEPAETPGFVKISVTDNGIGIRQENLSRIFAYGYTTRKNGHGFGLHSAALAAKVMGGSLVAASDGEDRGATFVLEIPTTPARRAD